MVLHHALMHIAHEIFQLSILAHKWAGMHAHVDRFLREFVVVVMTSGSKAHIRRCLHRASTASWILAELNPSSISRAPASRPNLLR